MKGAVRSRRRRDSKRFVRHSFVLVCVAGVLLASGCAREDGTRRETSGPVTPQKESPFGRKVSKDERWAFSDPKAVQDLQGTPFGEQEIDEFWTRKGWKLTKREEAYLALLDALTRDGYVTKISRWAKCPYNPVYQALVPIDVLGVHVRPGQEFNLDMCDADAELKLGTPRFARAKGYEEDHAEGHASDSAKN